MLMVNSALPPSLTALAGPLMLTCGLSEGEPSAMVMVKLAGDSAAISLEPRAPCWKMSVSSGSASVSRRKATWKLTVAEARGRLMV